MDQLAYAYIAIGNSSLQSTHSAELTIDEVGVFVSARSPPQLPHTNAIIEIESQPSLYLVGRVFNRSHPVSSTRLLQVRLEVEPFSAINALSNSVPLCAHCQVSLAVTTNQCHGWWIGRNKIKLAPVLCERTRSPWECLCGESRALYTLRWAVSLSGTPTPIHRFHPALSP